MKNLKNQFHDIVKRNEESLHKQSFTTSSPFGIIEYSIIGTGGPVFLISHGGLGGFDQAQLTARLHLKGNYTAICPSRFGHLRSELQKGSGVKQQASAYSWLLDNLEIKSAFIIGTSGGGPSAALFAQHHPEKCKGLILSCAVSQYLPGRPRSIYKSDFIYWLVTSKLQKIALKKIGVTEEMQKKLNPNELEYIQRIFEMSHPVSKRKAGLFRDIEEWRNKETWKSLIHLNEIKVPTMIIHAVDDTVIPYSHALNSAKQIENSKLLTLQDGGHLKLGHTHIIKDTIELFVSEHNKENNNER